MHEDFECSLRILWRNMTTNDIWPPVTLFINRKITLEEINDNKQTEFILDDVAVLTN